ncbi:MAG: TIGR02444 family protein [Gammaproteobacteria bacterium]
MNFPDSDFWNYSIQVYQIPQVEQACLGLQNTFAADVNLLLYCCWAGENKVQLSLDNIQQLITTAQPWQNIIQPLRDSRQLLKNEVTALDNRIAIETSNNLKEMELNAEHMSQLAIEKALDLTSMQQARAPSSHYASNNTALYLLQLDSVASLSEVSELLTQLLDAIYQDPETIQSTLMTMA